MPWGPHPHAYPQPPHRMTARDLLVAKGTEANGIWTPNALAILTGRHEGRSPCMNYGYCQWGCKSRAKSSMHVSYVPKAVLAGAEIRPRSRAVQLEVDDATGAVTGVVYVSDGQTLPSRPTCMSCRRSASRTPDCCCTRRRTGSPTGWRTPLASWASTCWRTSPTAASPASDSRSTSGPPRRARCCPSITTAPSPAGTSPAGGAG